jgi:hypothetical protein
VKVQRVHVQHAIFANVRVLEVLASRGLVCRAALQQERLKQQRKRFALMSVEPACVVAQVA